MKIDCTIKSIGECRSGTNASTGMQWYVRPIEVEWQEQRTKGDGSIYAIENSLKVEIWGDHASNFTIPIGSNVTLDIKFAIHEFNGKTFNNIRSTFIIMR